MAAQLQAWADGGELPFSWTTWNKQISCADPAQCGRYRPDFVWTIDDEQRVLVVEFDENGHTDYTQRCELARQAELALSFGGRPVIIIRYNPDTIQNHPFISTVPKKERDARFLKCIQEALAPGLPGRFENHLIVEYLFYPPIEPGSASGEWRQRFTFPRVQPDYETWAERVLLCGP